ncbi:MAG: ribose 5-phosphate isomerase B [Proteobacteria bacterium]|nr:ribose 5-phosphate isomerase B [Pseudomonadota bacterium]
MSQKTVFVGSDHAGYALKQPLLARLKAAFPNIDFQDCGTHSSDSVDYPNFAEKVAGQVAAMQDGRGILICGTGLGMCIAANKIKGIRATSSWNIESARLSREHNDSNIICLGARLIPEDLAFELVKEWLTTRFLGDRHSRRLDQIRKLEEKA